MPKRQDPALFIAPSETDPAIVLRAHGSAQEVIAEIQDSTGAVINRILGDGTLEEGGEAAPIALSDLTDVDMTGAAEDDVLTVQADGSIAPAPPSGGSQPIRFVRKTVNFDDAGLATTGVLIATIADGEVLLPNARTVAGTKYWLGASNIFLKTSWDGTDPQGAIFGDNGVDAPYEFTPSKDLTQQSMTPAISGEPGHPDLWSHDWDSAMLTAAWWAIGGDIDLYFKVTSGDDGETDPEATQGELEFILAIVTAP